MLFYMSLYKLSVVVLKEIERIQRAFSVGVGLGKEEDRLDLLEESLRASRGWRSEYY